MTQASWRRLKLPHPARSRIGPFGPRYLQHLPPACTRDKMRKIKLAVGRDGRKPDRAVAIPGQGLH